MRTALSALALGAVAFAGAAHAADLPYRKAPPPAPYVAPAPVYTWTGFYVGANLGGGWLERTWVNSDGFVVGGAQLGYNYQFSPLFVAGLETDFQGTSSRERWLGTVRGRLGITPFSPNVLIYGTGGFAYGEVRDPIFGAGPFGPFRVISTKTGWTAGGGVEWAFMPSWSAKVEYLHTELSDGAPAGFLPNLRPLRTDSNMVRLGLNYHFNFGAAPVYAKY